MGRLDVREGSAALLRRAADADRRKDFAAAAQLAGKAAAVDPRNVEAWRIAGAFREKQGDLAGALEAYEQALSLSPQDAGLARAMARLASFLDIPALAEQFLLHARTLDPGSVEIANDLAVAWCAQMRFSDAVELLRESLTANPGAALLWNTLGCVLFEQGQAGQSLVFFDEAIRLEPGMHTAHFNRANARKAAGDIGGALADCERAIALGADSPGQAAMYRYARALLLLNAGEIGAGWDAYAVRREEAYAEYVHHRLSGREWKPGTPLAGKRLLVMGEQGLGDEVLFANVLPDVGRAIGDEGKLIVAVEPRLVSLFQRSFPAAQVLPYETRREDGRTIRAIPGLAAEDYDAWARMGDLLTDRRRSLGDFPNAAGFLKADSARVAHWSALLDGFGPGPKVGVIWRSLLITSQRQKFYPPLEHWDALFRTPGVTFVNLQLGDCAGELRAIAQATGAAIRTLPSLDLRDDLDEIAALSLALDLVIGPATATTNIAAAVGAPTWFATTPDAWPRLGTAAFPWYPQARAFSGETGYDWAGVMAAIAEALAAEFGRKA
ncbi:tetratricopeptide repeat protein [Phenylobacterium sp. VNQ135]|uniref:tetratricopeptide repeat protein n=1 Tax=Phenylobacterium sp. VNQ135 TaxID=3400922 RepID=UPI003C09575D